MLTYDELRANRLTSANLVDRFEKQFHIHNCLLESFCPQITPLKSVRRCKFIVSFNKTIECDECPLKTRKQTLWTGHVRKLSTADNSPARRSRRDCSRRFHGARRVLSSRKRRASSACVTWHDVTSRRWSLRDDIVQIVGPQLICCSLSKQFSDRLLWRRAAAEVGKFTVSQVLAGTQSDTTNCGRCWRRLNADGAQVTSDAHRWRIADMRNGPPFVTWHGKASRSQYINAVIDSSHAARRIMHACLRVSGALSPVDFRFSPTAVAS